MSLLYKRKISTSRTSLLATISGMACFLVAVFGTLLMDGIGMTYLANLVVYLAITWFCICCVFFVLVQLIRLEILYEHDVFTKKYCLGRFNLARQFHEIESIWLVTRLVSAEERAQRIFILRGEKSRVENVDLIGSFESWLFKIHSIPNVEIRGQGNR